MTRHNDTANPKATDTDPDAGRCAAHARSGQRCRQRAVSGATVCHFHGGGAPQVRAAAERRVAQAQAVAAAERTFGVPLADVPDPDELILRELAATAAACSWLRARVSELDAGELAWSRTVEDNRQSGVGRAGVDTRREAKPHPYVGLLGEWSDRAVRQAEAAVRCGVSQRSIALAEHLGGQLSDVIVAVLDELHLTRQQRALAREVIPARLKAITGGIA